ncbi:MAG: hypothetical protein HOV81_13525 [Kofleriaceae bacterium]|nr:hypothetical protein [Kofleriaceae bacterium]
MRLAAFVLVAVCGTARSAGFVLGLGAAVERFIGDCRRECWRTYPEFMIRMPF